MDQMQTSKLGLDFKKVESAKQVSKNIAEDVQKFVDNYTTVAVERTLCRLMSVDGIDANEVPLPNVLVDHLVDNGVLNEGIMFYLGNAIVDTKLTAQEIAVKVSEGTLDITKLTIHSREEIDAVVAPYVEASMTRIKTRREKRENFIENNSEGAKPYLYVIVATGNIYEDVFRLKLLLVRVLILLRLSVLLVSLF